MRVAVLGGGLRGCCLALALADRGVSVTIFDCNETLLSRTAIANEGKIHLGYMYANDRGLSTARMMMRGALGFSPFFSRHLGLSASSLMVSRPASYLVHRDSQRTTEQVLNYLATVHDLVSEESKRHDSEYFGRDLREGLRQWSAAEREAGFDPQVALAVVDTPEVAIDPVGLAQMLRQRIIADPRIEVRVNHRVEAVEGDDRLEVVLQTSAGRSREQFDHVVNALWEGRFAVNEKRGLGADRPWLHRLKYGVSFRLAAGKKPALPSATFVSGPFGEVVSYGSGLTYLTWYPTCLQGISSDISPPQWPTYPSEPLRSAILDGTLSAMAEFVHSLRALDPADMEDVVVKGGVIVAWGETDIYDPASELHRRFEIGVTTTGRFHSIDPGKLTMAPYFANVCASRIVEGVA